MDPKKVLRVMLNKTFSRVYVFAGLALVLWAMFSWARLREESKHKIVSRSTKTVVGASWDPRDYQKLDKIYKKRESDSFKARQRRGISTPFVWPGLRNFQISMVWLEVLQGLHHESSYDGDYSWMFSKLNTLMALTDIKEIRYLTSLAPFFLVIGKDHIGANILMQEVIERAPDEYNAWFYSGYHAIENLNDRKLAADYILRASQFPFAPPYLKALHLRLKLGQEFLSSAEKKTLIEKEVKDPALLEALKKIRPEWFQN
jgi:hypothetical protein